VLSRVLSGFTLVTAGLVLLLCAHLFYSFQGRPFWLAVDALMIGVTTAVILTILVRLERDPVLSRLWGTHAGRIDLVGGLTPRMAIYLAIAVLTMFASFFPEVGSAIARWMQWLRPVQQAIP